MTEATRADVVNPEPAHEIVPSGQRRYMMWLLLIIYVLNFIDRQVVNILAEPIKLDLGLSDTQLGLLTGLAFAVFYTVLGIPIARLADRANRPRIIAIALAIWSGFTVLSGMAQNYMHLLLARIGVGVGEAGCTPPAHSLISDMYPKEKRASALAFYSMGIPIGIVIGTVAGGTLADAFGWRSAFLVCGVPGLIVAAVAFFTMVEPRARLAAGAVKSATSAGAASVADVLRTLSGKKTFWFISVAAAVKAFISYGYAPFLASFLLRVHGEEIGSIASQFGMGPLGFLAIFLGLMNGIGGVLGTYLGGQIADRYGQKDYRHWVGIPGIAAVIVIPIFVGAMLAPSALIALPLLGLNSVFGALWYGPVFATAQSIAPVRMRAVTAAILLFIVNLVGLGLGPLAVGGLSDFFNYGLGYGPADGLRWALIVSALAGVLSFAAFWLARRTIREDMVS